MPVPGFLSTYTVYDLFGTQPLTKSTGDSLAKAFMAQAEKQITRQQQQIAEKAQVDIDAARREMVRWLPVIESINAAKENISDARNRIESLDKTLVKMYSTLREPEDGDWTVQANKFNGLRSALVSAGTDKNSNNLLATVRRGDTYASNQVEYQASLDPRNVTVVFGRYLGSDYKINLPDDTFWMPSSTGQIQQYSSFPNGKIGYPQSTVSGSSAIEGTFDESALDFSVGNSVGPRQTFSGSLERFGLGVLQSWLYDGLETSEGRERALEDIEKARGILKNATFSFDAALARANNDLATAQSRFDEQQKAMGQLSQAANEKVETYVAKTQARVQSQLDALSSAQSSSAVQLIQVGGKVGQLFDLLS